jgi:DNA polymerase III delta subunit
MIYLFVGQDSLSKDAQLSKLKTQFLPKETEEFNLDILYARELPLKTLQEKLLCLPAGSDKRLVVIKEAEALKEGLRDFLLRYAKEPYSKTVLVLDFDCLDRKNTFLQQIQRYARAFRFRETVKPDTFSLGRYIALKKPAEALRILNQLLKDGERPERVLGGLRYVWERELDTGQETKKRLKSLLSCDIEIKTGRLKPVFALEKLVLSLCGLR